MPVGVRDYETDMISDAGSKVNFPVALRPSRADGTAIILRNWGLDPRLPRPEFRAYPGPFFAFYPYKQRGSRAKHRL